MRPVFYLAAVAVLFGAAAVSRRSLPALSDGSRSGNWADSARSVLDTLENGVYDVTGNRQQMSGRGVEMLKRIEGFALDPYPDAGGYSVGYGHFLKAGEAVRRISADEATAYLDADVREVENAVNSAVRVSLSQEQFDALCIFAYNIGTPRFRASTLLARLNAGDSGAAAAQFAVWNKTTEHGVKVVSSALVARRAKERSLFEGGLYA